MLLWHTESTTSSKAVSSELKTSKIAIKTQENPFSNPISNSANKAINSSQYPSPNKNSQLQLQPTKQPPIKNTPNQIKLPSITTKNTHANPHQKTTTKNISILSTSLT
jgi:hypothetical protein